MQISFQIYVPRELQEVSVTQQLFLAYLPWTNYWNGTWCPKRFRKRQINILYFI